MVLMTLNLKRKIANMAKTAINSDGILIVFQTGICNESPGHEHLPREPKTVCRANQTARLRTTPTMAAVIEDIAACRDLLPLSASTYGPPTRTQRKHGTKVAQVVSMAPRVPAIIGSRPPGLRKAARNPTNGKTRIRGPGVVSAKSKPVQHLSGCDPVVGFHGLLGHIRQYGVGPAKGHDSRFAEECRLLEIDAFGSQEDQNERLWDRTT